MSESDSGKSMHDLPLKFILLPSCDCFMDSLCQLEGLIDALLSEEAIAYIYIYRWVCVIVIAIKTI